ncbi:patatin-like phospholipase family protein [Amycolatopsis regifaucium]|uniref:Patatin n=1 Tax=Amycolatopsis regifaucium TaxID=546365 RepID=A0A154MP07_9PSEU|nr:patatin-like phospholipase family protein [Amycolatopsis regifaucium]KZB85587.1 patatin [Amycolatopsis regifaucium]OKA10660.1 patatin [Amycolatopsis regifaucium]SFI85779.1 NTE family protein [Amycolatopsis regifaucium]
MAALNLPQPIGFVLGGGGSLGAMQVGMLQALSEAGVAPDLVVGTSVGSLNAAVLALGDESGDRLHRIWSRMTRHEAFPGGVLSQVRTLRHSKTNLFPNTGLAAIVDEHVGEGIRFEDLALPLGVVATDVDTAEPLLIRSGPVLAPLLASCAIPGIYPPVPFEGRMLYDGGLVANVPMRQALAMGAKSLVVLDCAFPGKMPGTPQTFAEVMMFTAMISMRNQAVLEAPIAAAEVPVVYVPGPKPVRVSPLDFTHTTTLTVEAYEAAKTYLGELSVDGPGLYGAPGLVVA